MQGSSVHCSVEQTQTHQGQQKQCGFTILTVASGQYKEEKCTACLLSSALSTLHGVLSKVTDLLVNGQALIPLVSVSLHEMSMKNTENDYHEKHLAS